MFVLFPKPAIILSHCTRGLPPLSNRKNHTPSLSSTMHSKTLSYLLSLMAEASDAPNGELVDGGHSGAVILLDGTVE